MSDLRPQRSGREPAAGFTLVEVLVVVVLMAVIATVISATVAVIFRSTSPTNTRVADSATLHGLNTYLGRDASATGPGDFDFDPGASTGCVGGSPGTSLVKMTWVEDTGSAVNYIANYRFVNQGGGNYTIQRHTCSGVGAGPYGNVVVRDLTTSLGSTTPIVVGVSSGPDIVGVEMTVFGNDGEAIKVDGDSRNPAETLPSTTTTSTTTTPTTTTTTTTTLPCSLVSFTAAPNPVANQAGSPSRLTTPVTVSITTSGSCSTLTLQYDRGDGNGIQTDNFTGADPNYSLTLPANGGNPWADGTHVLTVYDGGTPLAPTLNLVVT